MALGTGSSRRGASAIGAGALVGVLLAVLVTAGATGCASRSSLRDACVAFEASESLNLDDAQPHPITLYVYPLSSGTGFEQTPFADLIEGAMPPGALAPPVPITLRPGDQFAFKETFPAETRQLGVLADFERAPGDPEGNRTQVVPARCGLRKPKLTLTERDIELR